MADYTTTAAVAAALDLTQTDYPTLQEAVTAASSLVNSFCGRQFGTIGTVSVPVTRYFDPTDAYCTPIDDASTITAVATDDGADGTYSTSWTTNVDWQATPVNGIGPNGETGWPYTNIVAIAGRYFSMYRTTPRPYVKVTGIWGWAAVPAAVAQATLFLASEMFKAAREAPFGSANLGDFGPVTIRGNRRVQDLLSPYRRSTAAEGRYRVA